MMATSPTSEIRDAVAKLIDVCRDGQHGFELAAHGVAEPILRAELLQYSGQRQEFVAELNDALRRSGEQPIEQACPIMETLRVGWDNLKQAVASHERSAVLTECERGEVVALDAYRRAAGAGLPVAINGTVNVQFQAITRVHDRLQSLREVARADAAAGH